MPQPSADKVIFQAALFLTDPAQRAEYLDVACQEDSALRERVESLLKSATDDGGFLAKQAVDSLVEPRVAREPDAAAATMSPAGIVTETIGKRVGNYKLLEQIGEGGFGVVYMADQQRPIQRRVALKIIKPGMDTRQVIARFEAERQALALMDHPNIAKVLDAGETKTGLPYFVMELVRGIPVTQYCDDRHLSTEERLKVFILICSAVQHAHQKGIIHRDIKPSNILVTTNGDKAVPMIIDFGIAKATQGRLTDKTLFTQFRQFIGTPAYMSPEQAQMSAVDVDTRSDIYSLGVLLYELLTGRTPLDSSSLREASYEEICRRIREEEAIAPSRRISSLQMEELKTVAKSRRIDPAHFPALVRGDLDWIAMKAVEKDRSRRYSSADAMSKDVERYLKGEPVTAVPPSAAYLLRKFVRRNQRLLATAGMIAAALVIGTVVSTWLAISKTRLNNQLAGEIVAKNAAVDDANEAKENLANQLTITQSAQAEAELNLSVSDLNRAYQAYADADVSLAMLILEKYQASHGDRFEWQCLRWLCETGDALHTIRDHTASVQSVAVTRAGVIVSGAADGTLLLHDLKSRLEIGRRKHSAELVCLDVSPDGKTLVTGDKEGHIVLWQIDSLNELRQLPTDAIEVRDVAFSVDGEFLAASCGGDPSRLELWDWNRSQPQPSTLQPYFCRQIDFSPEGSLIGATENLAFQLWNHNGSQLESTVLLTQAHSGWTSGISFSNPDGKYLATGSWDTVIRIWDVAGVRSAAEPTGTDLALAELRGHRNSINDLEFSPDGGVLASGSDDSTVRLWRDRPPWDSTRGPLSTLRGHTEPVQDIAFSADGEHLVSASADGTIKIWPGRPSLPPNVLEGHKDWVFDIAFSPDGRLLASGGFDGEVRLWNPATQEEVFSYKPHQHQVFRVAFSPDGQVLASCDAVYRVDSRAGHGFLSPGTICLLDVDSKERDAFQVPTTAGVRAIDFTPDGDKLVIGDHNGRLWIYDLQAKTFGDPVIVGEGLIDGLACSADGELIAVSGFYDDNTNSRRLITYRTADLQQQISNIHEDFTGAWRLTFAPRTLGNNVLTSPMPSGIDFFDLYDGRKIDHWPGPESRCAAFSPDGRTLATSGMDQSVRLWNVESKSEVAKLDGHRGIVIGLAFSADGSMLASSSEDKTIRIWRTLREPVPTDKQQTEQ